ncbi:MAG: ferredoxin [bacterium]
MKVVVDRNVCISAADCVALAPETFELDAEGKAIVKNPIGNDLPTILEAAKACPVACIYVYDDAGKQLWPEQGNPPSEAK